jgi:hypothetical protein
MPVGLTNLLAYTLPVVEMPLTSSTYFIYRAQLSIISHEIVTQLYCAATIKEKWSDVQETIERIDHRLLAWRDSLPREFDIMFDTSSEPDWNDPYSLPRIGLAMFFNSSRMILFRPCLCRFEGSRDKLPQKSKDFEQEAAENCIHSARRMISILTWNAKSAQKLYAISSWWNTLHYLCEALSVMMLEMAFEAQHLPDESACILDDAKKGISWLAMMSDQSIAARKAWEIFDSLIRLVAPVINWSVFDMPTEAPVPHGYNWRRFSTAPASYLPPDSPDQLPQENVPQYQPSQPTVIVGTTTAAWAGQDSRPYISDAGFSAPGPGPSDGQGSLASNLLDNNTAIERFSNLGRLHGHYDDPWQRIFDLNSGGLSIGMDAPRADDMLGPGMGMKQARDGSHFTQSAFGRDVVGGYENLSPMSEFGREQGFGA